MKVESGHSLTHVNAQTNISDVTERESLEFPSFAPGENKFLPVDSLGNIKSVMGNSMSTDKKKIGVGFGVMLMKEEKILLGRRHSDPNKANSELHGEGTWTMPGGKLEFGESFEDGAKREVYEETGLQLNGVKIICVNNDKNGYAHFITIGLFSDKFSGELQVMEPDEIVEWQWFGLDNLPVAFYFPSARIIENYRKKLFYIPQ